ncbi:MAG: hypothetical protein ACRDQD_31185 [Nocardioidaceae bacterium]
MKRLSNELDELSVRTKKTEDIIEAARTRDRERLRELLDTLKSAVDDQSAKAGERMEKARADADAKGHELKTTVDNHFAGIRAKAEQHKVEHDMRRAEHRADDAEYDAITSVDFAVYALDQAEYAIIEAAVCRVEADELAAQH